jgi:peptidoglycan/xylan/chitin deacetylase (PgdA/CDA1 family)
VRPPWRRRLRRAFLRVAKWLGAFAVSRALTRRALRIVCYHGFAVADEHEWNPGLFIQTDDFERRLRFLARSPYTVLPLDEALAALDGDRLPPNTVVITIDDGFFSTYSRALPHLIRYAMPAVLYVSTYYVENNSPVFNLAVSYVFWRTREAAVDLTALGVPHLGRVDWAGLDEGARQAVVQAVVRRGESLRGQAQRDALLHAIGECLWVDTAALVRSRALSFVTPAEAQALQTAGVDLQLHTHRHRSPGERTAALAELRDNDRFLRTLGRRARHFCYPSGERERWRREWLIEAGIASAVTTTAGLNFAATDRYALRRFLDSHSTNQIEFEAELSGFCDGVRAVIRRLGTLGIGARRRDCYNAVAPCVRQRDADVT